MSFHIYIRFESGTVDSAILTTSTLDTPLSSLLKEGELVAQEFNTVFSWFFNWRREFSEGQYFLPLRKVEGLITLHIYLLTSKYFLITEKSPRSS